MACTELLAPPVAMATTRFARKIGSHVSTNQPWKLSNRLNPLRMNWVVVTGKNSARGLRMHWIADADC
ncbi:MAG: hypothetical protein WBW36_03700 [Candidatus Sulfotelmatobacter sp.]